MKKLLSITLITLILSFTATTGMAKNDPPEISIEGLTLVEKDRRGEIYADSAIDWNVYSQIQLDRATVAFRKHWKRDQNRYDPETGRVYHVVFDPPAPEAASRLIQRSDDTEQVFGQRLQEYRDKTAPLLPYYEQAGVLRRIDGVGAIDEVGQRLWAVLGG